MHLKIDGLAAWDAARKDPGRNFTKGKDRFGHFPVSLTYQPKFALDRGATFFCIGSCFARNVEEHLLYNGMEVLSRRIVSPRAEWAGRVNGLVNKFTTASMLNELRWAIDPPADLDRFFAPASDETVADLQLSPGVKDVPLARAIERRRYLMTDYFPRALAAEVVVLTLGLDECWFDNETGLHLNATPSYWAVKREPGRYEVRILDYDENIAALHAIRDVLRSRNAAARILVAVSPVPLLVSFTDRDPALATMRAKSMLRTAAEAFSRAHDDVDYFPSYEMIALTPRNRAFAPDCVHVTDSAVARVMKRFLVATMGSVIRPPAGFTELAYLGANPDVEDEVRLGRYGSGYEHWMRLGRDEGRPLVPADGPTPLMRTTGVR